MRRILWVMMAALTVAFALEAHAEFRSAKDMQKECRVALNVLQGHAEKNFENALYTGECIGYMQAAADAALAFKDNVDWYKICLPDKVTVEALIRKFIVFVDKYPQYTLANTAFQLMLKDEYPCPKK